MISEGVLVNQMSHVQFQVDKFLMRCSTFELLDQIT